MWGEEDKVASSIVVATIDLGVLFDPSFSRFLISFVSTLDLLAVIRRVTALSDVVAMYGGRRSEELVGAPVMRSCSL